MIEWLSAKAQVDIGNFTVGMATLAVAASSFYVALSANAHARSRVFVDVGGLWIEEMRKALSAYLGTVDAILAATDPAERRRLMSRLAEQDAYIRLKFDLNDPSAATLFPLLDEVRAALAGASPSIDRLVGEIVSASRHIFERRWQSETHRLTGRRKPS